MLTSPSVEDDSGKLPSANMELASAMAGARDCTALHILILLMMSLVASAENAWTGERKGELYWEETSWRHISSNFMSSEWGRTKASCRSGARGNHSYTNLSTASVIAYCRRCGPLASHHGAPRVCNLSFPQRPLATHDVWSPEQSSDRGDLVRPDQHEGEAGGSDAEGEHTGCHGWCRWRRPSARSAAQDLGKAAVWMVIIESN
jgi:hypothetical protein